MKPVYHEGELAVQSRAGVREMSARIGKSIHPNIPLAAQEFLSSQPLVVMASIDRRGKVWASMLSGQPGFMRAINDRAVQINALPNEGDPLRENLISNDSIGMVVIEFASRRRMRISGTAKIGDDSKIYVHTEQVYANCPKYIQARTWEHTSKSPSDKMNLHKSTELNEAQQLLIRNADTFFIASHHPDGGADASHRGGNPGFIRIIDGNTLIFPDYSGNTMFQTLGNLTVNPNCGLLFIDFEQDNALQLTGSTEIIWEPDRIKEFTGAERIVEFRVKEVIQTSHSNNLHWQFNNYSTFNPK